MASRILIKYGVDVENTENCLHEILEYFINNGSLNLDSTGDNNFGIEQRILHFQNRFSNFKSNEDWIDIGMSVICVICAALAAGLTLGFMTQDSVELKVKISCGTEKERIQASKVESLTSNHHLLLVTLLLFNSLANETLPLFLDHVIPSYLAIILSVSLVLIFGEIVPSAIFTGSRKLQLAAHFAEFTQFLIWIFFPIAKPISMLLDYIIDHEETKIYSRQELAAFVSVQHSLANGTTDSLSGDEVMIVHGLLKMSTQCVANIMTPIEQVFTLQSNTVLDQNKLGDILRQGFSRIPIYEGNDCGNTRGYLLVKKLIVVDPNDKRLVSSFSLKRPLVVHPKLSLLELLNQFQQGTHLAVASRNPAKTIENLDNNQPLIGDSRVIGIITLEDVFEELLQEEIEDEHDKHRLKVEKHYLNVIKACISKKKKKKESDPKKKYSWELFQNLDAGSNDFLNIQIQEPVHQSRATKQLPGSLYRFSLTSTTSNDDDDGGRLLNL